MISNGFIISKEEVQYLVDAMFTLEGETSSYRDKFDEMLSKLDQYCKSSFNSFISRTGKVMDLSYEEQDRLEAEQEEERYTEDADDKKTVSKVSVKQLRGMLEKYDDDDTVFLNIWGMSDCPSTELKIGDAILMENDY